MSKRKKRILVLIHPRDREDPSAGNIPLGTPAELVHTLGAFNAQPDGSARSASLGTAILHGPGFTVEYASAQDELQQAMVVVNDQDFAWPVLSKLCRTLGWRMQDTESGQIFG
ncbi:MAG: hypothetical protein AB8F26_09990 [Phycisphaerales bacterium]